MDPNESSDNHVFRESYRKQHIGRFYHGAFHLSFTLGFSFAIIFWSLSQLVDIQPLQYLTVPLVFLYANLAEYFVHKGPMHHPRKGLKLIYKRHATQHHVFFTDQQMQFDSIRDFKAVLFPPILITLFFVLFALPFGLLAGWLLSNNVSYLFVATVLSYFAIYEILHTLYHVNESAWIYKIPILRAMRKLHQNHHRLDLMNQYNFNITFPIGDLIFGTYYRATKNPQSVMNSTNE